MVLPKEQCAESRKAPLLCCCNQVQMKVGGQILWNVMPYLRNVTDPPSDGKTPNEKTFWEAILKDLLFLLVHSLSIILQLRKISPESINLERKFFLDCSSDTLSTRGEFGKVTHWSQTLRSWRRWTLRKSTQKDSMLKRWCFPKGEFTFPIADGRIKTLGGDQDLRTSTLIRHWSIQGESNIDFLEESEGSFPQPHDSLPVAEAVNDFWSMLGSYIHRHHVEPRVKLHSRREESFPVPLKHIDVSRTTHTNLDVKQEKRIDGHWNIDGSRDLSDPWTGFTQFTLLDEKAFDGHMWSREEINEKTVDIHRSFMTRTLEVNGKNAKLKEKHKLSNEKLHLENTRKLRGIHFIGPEDKKFKETVKKCA